MLYKLYSTIKRKEDKRKMLNTYTLEVHKKNNAPVFIVNINHIALAGIYFFNNMKSARDFIEKKKTLLSEYAPLKYCSDNIKDNSYLELIKTFLNDNNYHIGENGYTYYKEA